jgi:phage gp45-like
MVNATVDNSPISIQLGEDETTTVPSGEVWKVTVTHSGGTPQLKINGNIILNGSTNSAGTLEIVVTGGDTFKKYQGYDTDVHISGFVVA